MRAICFLVLGAALVTPQRAQENPAPQLDSKTESERWNWHIQNTDIVQGYPGFPAKYSGPNSLQSGGQIRESVSLDLMAGIRLWPGGEAHVDGMMWQGYGVSHTLGVEGFPNGESFRLGTTEPNVNLPRLLVRQVVGLGGEKEKVPGDGLNLGGERDISRVTFTLGRMNVKDIFDNNTYANDPRTQFLNWALMANEAWDYPADSLGYMTGFAAELNQPRWAARYGFFQMPRVSNGTALDSHFLQAWGMVSEFEYRYAMPNHPGTVRLLSFLNRARMGSYQDALDQTPRPADIEATRDYRFKFGFGLNMEQEISTNIGVFLRVGWSDGRTEGWTFADVDRSVTAGLSFKGGLWNRPNDTLGVAGVFNGASSVHHRFLAAGGKGILSGDGALSYGWEKIGEAYHNAELWGGVGLTVDYQFIENPAFNRDRGPVHVFGARIHWSY